MGQWRNMGENNCHQRELRRMGREHSTKDEKNLSDLMLGHESILVPSGPFDQDRERHLPYQKLGVKPATVCARW
jgi:hypothetical protein